MLPAFSRRPPLASFVLALLCVAVHAAPPGASLPRSTPEAEGVESAGVRALVDALDARVDAVHSVMLLRHGRVIAEGWRAPYAADDVHILYSVTKSFTSTAVGFAVQEGRLNLDDRVISFFPDLAPPNPSKNLAAMRVRDLLRMNSGHQDDTMDRLRTHADGAWVRAFLALPVENKPGTRFVYNSGGSYMLAAILQRATGQTLEAYLTPRLFEPLGIAPHPWALSKEKITLSEGGLSLRTEDLAKFGQFYLQQGRWGDRQLLPAAWIAAATSLQTSNGSDPDSNWDAGYGYQFWLNKTTGYRADGALGQLCLVLPKYDVVVAITSGTSDMGTLMDVVWQHLLPALHYTALPPDPGEQAKLAERLSALAIPVVAGEPHSARESAVSGRTYAFPANEQGLLSVRLESTGDQPRLVFEEADGAKSIPCGVGRWVRGATGFQRGISRLWEQSTQGLAACGAWTTPDTFTARLCFVNTPYVVTYRLTFEGDRLRLDTDYNVRWGPTKLPPLTGTRRE